MRRAPVVGVDIGGSKVLAVVLADGHRVLGSSRLPTQHGRDGIVETAAAAAAAAAADAGVPLRDVQVVGVGVPGLVHPVSGVVSHAVNLAVGPDPVDLAARLRARIGVRVVVENDVNAAARGAFELRGPGRGDLALLSIGTGLAAGLVVRGALHRGARGGAGEIGHVPIDPAGALCTCGQRGCLETIASGSALAASWPDDERGSVWQAAQAGDRVAAGAIARFSAGVAAAVRLLALSWDVESVLLAGGVTDVGQPLLIAVRRALTQAAQESELLAALDLPHRLEILPPGSPVAAIGAGLAARATLDPQQIPRAQEVG